MTTRLAIDIGGTFTDLVLDVDGEQFPEKLLTTHQDPTEAVLNGTLRLLEQCSVRAGDVALVLHGTTLATNAIIERKGAKTALLTTSGHRDVLEMAYENRFEQYDVNIERPQPLIPRKLRIPVVERIGAGGNVLKPLEEESVLQAAELLRQHEIESVAVGFLHSYANDEHEIRVGEILQDQLPNCSICLSSQVCPEIREYERFSTTVANAYVLPTMSHYLHLLEVRLKEIGCAAPCFMMTSGGGLTTLRTAARFPIRLVESGPAGGAILAARKAKELGSDRVLSFDMGGTTAKICLIDDMNPQLSRSFEVDRRYRFKKGSGLPVRIPVIEMVEIGAGGGSIASKDVVGRTTVGPESAGSDPGPACYGLGGKLPTVTDADVVLGRLDAAEFAGGQMSLDSAQAEKAIENQFGQSGTEVSELATVIAEVVDENMALAARGHAAEWGKAIEGRTMVAYGGAAPIHAARLLEKLRLDRVVVPKDAGVGSALGFLTAPISYEVVKSLYMKLSRFNVQLVKRSLLELEQEAMEVVSEATSNVLEVSVSVLMRYAGQGYEIVVSVDQSDLSKENLLASFERSYLNLYHRLIPNSDVEIMSWTLRVSTPLPDVDLIENPPLNKTPTQSSRAQTMVFGNESLSAKVVSRNRLNPGDRLSGPALVTEPHTTTVVPIKFTLTVNAQGDLILEKQS